MEQTLELYRKRIGTLYLLLVLKMPAQLLLSEEFLVCTPHYFVKINFVPSLYNVRVKITRQDQGWQLG